MIKNKVLGCIIGGACGDALGYPVEFCTRTNINWQFGPDGIRAYPFGDGLISDDTQMTLFTIDGLLKNNDGIKTVQEFEIYKENIYQSYLDWYATQNIPFRDRNIYYNYSEDSLLLNMENLYDLRAPGNTCLSALKSGKMGSIINPINDSMGCGGVMRVAPIGLCFSPEDYNEAFIGSLAAEVAASTHGHPLGYIPAAMLALIINKLFYTNVTLETAIWSALEATCRIFRNNPEIDKFKTGVKEAIELSKNNKEDYVNIHKIGGGWVGHEALYIAIYCALRHEDSFEEAIIAAVNHNGDSDSTGSITGNIMGCYCGFNKIPEHFVDSLELRNLIIVLVNKLLGS